MKIFYGWIIVGVGIVVTCIGVGAMLSLSIFLQPMTQAMGWSRTGISTAALVNWLAMGVGAFLWGALSDRFGTRAVVPCACTFTPPSSRASTRSRWCSVSPTAA